MSIVKRHNVIHALVKALESGYLIPSFHALEQMKKRDVQWSDIEEMISRSHREFAKDTLTSDKRNWKYALRGLNDSGEKDIRLIIIFHDPEILIVTVIDKNRKDN